MDLSMRSASTKAAIAALLLGALPLAALAQTRTEVAAEEFGGTLGNFTQTNPNWGNMTITGGIVHGSFASQTDALQSVVYSGSGSFAGHQYSSIKITALPFISADYSIGVTCFASTDTNGARDHYSVTIQAGGAGPTYVTVLDKVVNGTRTQQHSASVTWSVNDYVSLDCDGTTVTVMKGTSHATASALGGSFTWTDSSLTTGNPGIAGSGSSSGATGDSWSGGTVSAGGGGSVVPIISHNRRQRAVH